MHRYTIKNHTHFVQFEAGASGLSAAKKFRRRNQAFKRRVIREVLQLTPSEIELGKIYELK